VRGKSGTRRKYSFVRCMPEILLSIDVKTEKTLAS
jgi:hypothetical protein